jgi:hypothetical protein
MNMLAWCLFCMSVDGAGPFPQMPREVGAIKYRHEVLYGTHLLRLSTTDLILDSDGMRADRSFAFARDYADRTCSGRYRIVNAQRLTTYAGQFAFRCK